jgi:flagellar basal body rod protein FlgC
MSITGTALSGLWASQARLTASAANIANSNSLNSLPDGTSTAPAPIVDLTQEAVEQLSAVQDFKANAKVVEAADIMAHSTFEIWG